MYSQLKIIQAIFMPCYWSFNQVVHCTLCNFTTKDAKNEFCLLSQVICHGYLLQTCQASVLTRLNTTPMFYDTACLVITVILLDPTV